LAAPAATERKAAAPNVMVNSRVLMFSHLLVVVSPSLGEVRKKDEGAKPGSIRAWFRALH
jgi:hypothetical protein